MGYLFLWVVELIETGYIIFLAFIIAAIILPTNKKPVNIIILAGLPIIAFVVGFFIKMINQHTILFINLCGGIIGAIGAFLSAFLILRSNDEKLPKPTKDEKEIIK